MPTITPLYAALLALLLFALSVRTLRLRRRLRIAVGDAGNLQMLRAMRAHANLTEYAPISLLLLLMLELLGASAALVHVLCLCLLIGRLAHAWGMSQAAEDFRFRVSGMALTFTAMLCASVGVLALLALR